MFVKNLENKVYEELNSANALPVMKELEELGEGALPLLEDIFSGIAKNKFGVEYRSLGMPLTRALIVARNLGNVSKPLEHYFTDELKNMHPEAPAALGALSELEEESIEALCEALKVDLLYSIEAAAVLSKFELLNHEAVKNAQLESNIANEAVKRLKIASFASRCGRR